MTTQYVLPKKGGAQTVHRVQIDGLVRGIYSRLA
jgi:hypothetical protein